MTIDIGPKPPPRGEGKHHKHSADLVTKELNSQWIETCEDRGEMDFLYRITQMIAESDSIGESYGYCNDYSKDTFQYELMGGSSGGCGGSYLFDAGLPVYKVCLEHLDTVINQT